MLRSQKFSKYNFMKYLTLFVISLAIISCKSKKEIASEVTPVQESVAEVSSDPLIAFSKGACFGKCPVYSLTISQGGDMVYEGKRHTEKMGKHTKKLDLESTNELIALFEEYKFMQLKDLYESSVADLPSATISYTKDGVTKTVVGKMERPERVLNLQKKLELIANSNQGWTLIEASKNNIPEEKLIKNQIIISTKGGPQLAKWFDKMRVNHGIRIVKRLSAATDSWLISYNTKEYEPEDMLHLIRSNDFVTSAEFNKETEKR